MEKISVVISIFALLLSGYTYYDTVESDRRKESVALERSFYEISHNIYKENREYSSCISTGDKVCTEPDFHFLIEQMRIIKGQIGALNLYSNFDLMRRLEGIFGDMHDIQLKYHYKRVESE